MPRQKTPAQLNIQVHEFNQKNKPGDKVSLRKDNGEVVEVTVAAPATLLGGHSAVGWFEGISGCYSLDNVIIPT